MYNVPQSAAVAAAQHVVYVRGLVTLPDDAADMSCSSSSYDRSLSPSAVAKMYGTVTAHP